MLRRWAGVRNPPATIWGGGALPPLAPARVSPVFPPSAAPTEVSSRRGDRKSRRPKSNLAQISNVRFFFNDTAATEIYTLSLHDALPISDRDAQAHLAVAGVEDVAAVARAAHPAGHDLGGGRLAARAPREVLADLPAQRARQVVRLAAD